MIAGVTSSSPAVGMAAKLSVIGAAAQDRAELEAELLAARKAELVQMRPQLEDLLRRRPELARGAARAFAKLDDRESLFVVSRALVVCASDPDVKTALREGAKCGHAARREVSLIALASSRDEESLGLAQTALEDAAAAPCVRAAGAWALALDAEHAPPAAFSAARSVAQAPAGDPHLRAEALHLLAAKTTTRSLGPDERALAAQTLSEAEAPVELVLAAARLALEAGEDRASVARSLASRKDTTGALARAANALQGDQREHRGERQTREP